VPRRSIYIGMFVVAALVILACAEHFAESLVDTGTQLGVDQFVLVQWVAPVASEAPELIVACLYAWRLRANESLGHAAVVEGEPVDAAGGHDPAGVRAVLGLLLRAAAGRPAALRAAAHRGPVTVRGEHLIKLALSARAATVLFVLIAVRFFPSILLSAEVDRVIVMVLSGVYLLLACIQLVRHRRELLRTTRDGLVTPFDELTDDDRVAASS